MPSARSRPVRLDVRLLGPPEVLVDGAPIQVDTRKAIAILAVLATERRPFARDELATLLWPDSDDLAARGALRRTLSSLRTAVGDGPLLIDRSRVALVADQVRTDLATLEAASRSEDRTVLADAVGLARGVFLAGFTLRDSPDFDDWRATQAVAAERTVLLVLDRTAALAEADGDLTTAIAAATRRLDLDPLDEAGHVRLMDLLAASGQRGAALRQYRSCVAILDRELGVGPLVTTTARYEAIRDEEPPASAPATMAGPSHARLPATTELPMVGRDEALATLVGAHEAVGAGAGRLVAIVGEAGIGKTRLAATLAARVSGAGGAVLAATAHPAERSIAYGPIVELLRAALARRDAAARLARMEPSTRAELARLVPAIDARHVPTASPEGPGAHARLVAAIADGLGDLVAGPVPGILWIDDAQWIDQATIEAIGYLHRRLASHPVLLLLTWRAEDLDGSAGRFAAGLTDDPRSTVVRLERLDDAAVAALVRTRAGSSVAPELVERLVERSEGLPLYVAEVLAAGLTDASGATPVGVSAVLRERLRAVGETTDQILTTAAVIGRSFDLPTVRHASGRSEDETVDALDEAVHRGLIREGAAGYDFAHGALRELAYDALSLTRRRSLHRRVAEALRLDLSGAGRDDLGRLVRIAVHERAAGRDAEAADAYALASVRAEEFFANAEAIDYGEAALALGHPDAVALHAAIGRMRTRLGDYDGAIAALESAAALAGEDQLPGLEWTLARAHLRRGDLAAASHHLEAALAGPGRADDALAARVWVDRAVIRRRAGDREGAADAAAEALAAATRAADAPAVGAAQRMLGLVALDAGAVEEAIDVLTQAVRSAARDPDPTATIAALASLALATAASGEIDAAVTHGESAIAVCRRIGDRHLEAAVENHLADLLHAAGREEPSRARLRSAVAAFAEVGGDPADPDPGIWLLSAS